MYEKGRKKGTIRFQLEAQNGIHRVCVSGDFNQWQATPMRRQRGYYVAILPVAGPGRYEYKFLVNDQWQLDPDNITHVTGPTERAKHAM